MVAQGTPSDVMLPKQLWIGCMPQVSARWSLVITMITLGGPGSVVPGVARNASLGPRVFRAPKYPRCDEKDDRPGCPASCKRSHIASVRRSSALGLMPSQT